ncbi:MAG: hypothetical protein IKY16_02815 [Bacteroidales bacterium]|nr:hypothetical protein [Bacteroidales bacterium]
MDYKELNQVLANLAQAMDSLESLYIENEGEVTEQTEQMEAQISGLKELLTGEGIDLLGAWLKSKEDRKKSLKAEKDYITRQMAAIDETIDFIKAKVNQILVATGQEKVKGDRGYQFKVSESVTTSVDKDLLKNNYEEKVEKAIRRAGVPVYIGVSLSASVSKVGEDGVSKKDKDLFVITKKDTITFTKPRASKEA